jgi:putative ABC transport system substrate-binding protein
MLSPELGGTGMKRRDFITFLGAAAFIWSPVARAQQPTMPVIGFLNPGSATAFATEVEAFRRGLMEAGYVEGRNVLIEYRWAEGQYDRLPILATDLVNRRVSIIAALGSSAPARAAKAATSTIPIVFQTGDDPVEEGLVTSMNRPDGNVTGVSRMNVATDSKRLELLRDVLPNATVMACFANPTSPRFRSQVESIKVSARSLGLELHVINVSTANDLEPAFATVRKQGASALLLATDPSFTAMWEQIAELGIRNSVPIMGATRAFASKGGLMSYGASLPDSFRQAGRYVGRILHGDKPADLPVQQPTKFDMVLNLKTAKALGLTIPPTILAIADEVIE